MGSQVVLVLGRILLLFGVIGLLSLVSRDGEPVDVYGGVEYLGIVLGSLISGSLLEVANAIREVVNRSKD